MGRAPVNGQSKSGFVSVAPVLKQSRGRITLLVLGRFCSLRSFSLECPFALAHFCGTWAGNRIPSAHTDACWMTNRFTLILAWKVTAKQEEKQYRQPRIIWQHKILGYLCTNNFSLRSQSSFRINLQQELILKCWIFSRYWSKNGVYTCIKKLMHFPLYKTVVYIILSMAIGFLSFYAVNMDCIMKHYGICGAIHFGSKP